MDVFKVFSVTFLGIFLCFIGVESSCYSDYEQCYSTYQQVSRPRSYSENWTNFCNAADTFDTCLKNDITSCGSSDTEPPAYTNYVHIAADSKKSCNVVSCASKCASLSAKCTDLNNYDKLTLAEGVECCITGLDIIQCLRDCGDNNLVSSDPVLQRSDVLCHGYNDHCPGMYECFGPTLNGGFVGAEAVCSNVGTFITCIEEKCANKPQIGQQSLAKIKEVYKNICTVVGKYPEVASCETFTSCIAYTPSLPGTVVGRLPSFLSARNSDRWCQIAKSYVFCGEDVTEGDSCNQGTSFTTDVSTVKTATDQACTGVREPCFNVLNCLELLGSKITLKDTCPNIPDFVTCTDNALISCGDGSRVKADYSLVDVKDLYVETCNAMNEELYQCNLMETCLDLQLPTTTGDMMVEFSDQISWCRKLNRMLKCTADLSTACQQPKAVHDKFMMLYNKVNKLCPSKVSCASNCASLSAKCTDLNNYDKLTLVEGVECCKTGLDIIQCLRDCGDNDLVSSDPVLQRSDVLCRGYNDHCPGMYECFGPTLNGGFVGAEAVCRNVGTFITCIEEKCANKPQIGQQSLAKIKEVYNRICTVVSKYPSVASCQTFTSCIEKTPSLPGTVVGRLPSFLSARNSDRWCQIAKSYVICGEEAAEGNSCNQGTSFTTDVSTVKTATDQACTGVREPCLEVSNCLVWFGSKTTLKDTCPNIPNFVTCTDNALTTCGDGSRVKAEYSLDDVKDLYVETCNAMNDELYQCNLMETCLDLQLPTYIGDMIVEFSDQTSWCRKLNRMLKCTADLSTACQQPKSVHDKFMMLYNKVNKLCPSKVSCASNCASLSAKCTDLNNYDKLTLVEGVECCKTGLDIIQCLRDCGDNDLVSSDPVLQRSDVLCRGYNDHCPGMYECFGPTLNGGFVGAEAVCRNVGTFITCIEEKCANKPQIGQQSLAKIKEVYNRICTVVSKYPSVASCQTFTSCIEKTPSLPGTVVGRLPSFLSARNSDRWCQIAKSYVICGEEAAEGNSCNQGTSFTTDVSTVKTATDQACTGVREPCLEVSNCLVWFGSKTTLKDTCPNIPNFVTCTDNALTTCGDGSRVKAEYSLDDVKDLYVETCNAMNDELYQCNLMETCLDLQLPTYIGDMIVEFSDQTSWCRKLNRMLKCTADLSTACQQPKSVHDKFMMLYNKVNKLCPSKVSCASNCASLSAKCTDLNNYDKLTLVEGVECCKTGLDIIQCLRDCGDNDLVSSDPVLQRSDVLCRGYNDHCPGMYECFGPTLNGGFVGAEAVCRNVGTFITCIEEKCANKPQIGQQSLAKIKEVYNRICTVVSKYPSVASCQTFTSCIEKTPSLPGTVVGRLPSFLSARNSDRWCQIAKSYVICGEEAAEGNSCNQGTSFTTDVSTVKTATDQACTGVREPCLEVSNCLVWFGSKTTLKDTCPNIPNFVTCTDNALTTCGDGSRVKAEYSLDDVKDLYVETCNAMNDELYQCNLMETCLDLQLPTYIGDMIVEFSDQTSWCRKLNRMLKCTADLSTACQQPKAVHDKFMMLFNKVNKLCHSKGPPMEATTPTTMNNTTDTTRGVLMEETTQPTVDDGNGAGTTRVTGVVLITVLMTIFY